MGLHRSAAAAPLHTCCIRSQQDTFPAAGWNGNAVLGSWILTGLEKGAIY